MKRRKISSFLQMEFTTLEFFKRKQTCQLLTGSDDYSWTRSFEKEPIRRVSMNACRQWRVETTLVAQEKHSRSPKIPWRRRFTANDVAYCSFVSSSTSLSLTSEMLKRMSSLLNIECPNADESERTGWSNFHPHLASWQKISRRKRSRIFVIYVNWINNMHSAYLHCKERLFN